MLACHTCRRSLFPFVYSSFLHGSTAKLSNKSRPQRLPSLKSSNLVAFSSSAWVEKGARYISKEVKYTHAFLFPHLALNLSNMGAPYLDYFHHPGIAVGLAIGVCLYPALFLFAPRITNLSFHEGSSKIKVKTAFCQQNLEIPLSVCTFKPDQRSLFVSGQRYKFSIGKFNAKSLTILKQSLRASDKESNRSSNNNSYSRFNLMWNEVKSLSYIIVVSISIACLIIHGFIFGYTDLMYSVINLIALIDREKVMERWKPLIK